jgi:hypothetical protein
VRAVSPCRSDAARILNGFLVMFCLVDRLF